MKTQYTWKGQVYWGLQLYQCFSLFVLEKAMANSVCEWFKTTKDKAAG